jgi:hypothetical protein
MKSAGYDLITYRISKELHAIGMKYRTELFSIFLLKGYFTVQWKVAQGNHLKRRNPTGLLSIVSKDFEKLLLKRWWKVTDLYPIICSASERGTSQQNRHIESLEG